MHKQDDYNEIVGIAMQAMALMLKKKTPPTPENYKKCYKHAAGLFLSENNEGKKQSVPEARPKPALSKVEQQQVSVVKTILDETTQETAGFSNSMDDISKSLEAITSRISKRKSPVAKTAKQPVVKKVTQVREDKFVPFSG